MFLPHDGSINPSIESQLIRTKVVYQGKYVRTEEQIVKHPDGSEGVMEIVSPPDAVGVLPIDADGRVYLVRQYRHAIRQITLEIPAGILDTGETPEETGKRECEEEIGFTPGPLNLLCSYYHSVGFSTGKISVFWATGLVASQGAHTDPHEFIERVIIPFEVLYQKVIAGEIVDSKTILAALWYQQKKDQRSV